MGGGGLSCADIWPHVLPVIVFDVVHSYLLFNWKFSMEVMGC